MVTVFFFLLLLCPPPKPGPPLSILYLPWNLAQLGARVGMQALSAHRSGWEYSQLCLLQSILFHRYEQTVVFFGDLRVA